MPITVLSFLNKMMSKDGPNFSLMELYFSYVNLESTLIKYMAISYSLLCYKQEKQVANWAT